MYELLLAQGAGISPDWVLKLVSSLGTFAAAVITAVMIAKRGGGKQRVSASIEHQPVEVKEAIKLVTMDEFEAWASGVEKRLDAMQADAAESRRVARDSLGNVHKRIDAATTELAQVSGTMRATNQNVLELLRLAIGKPTRGRTGG